MPLSRLAENRIREAMRDGTFDGLPARGAIDRIESRLATASEAERRRLREAVAAVCLRLNLALERGRRQRASDASFPR
jgi:hypothetical protein